ncbi:zinc finger protein [Macleaya cordata]|uniref:Zinc finger protein n=1 Tax=Macleaya cordata TaxID=56857 RepID=A0A200Q561_MACCD|nr:zinc finger protein [Macleaya cordata]
MIEQLDQMETYLSQESGVSSVQNSLIIKNGGNSTSSDSVSHPELSVYCIDTALGQYRYCPHLSNRWSQYRYTLLISIDTDLTCNLRTFESNFRSSKKSKNIAFQASKQATSKGDLTSDNSSDDEIALLSRQFKKYLKKKGGFQKFDKYNHSSSKYKPHENFKSFDKKFEKKKSDEIQCYKCRGFGHMASSCANKGSSNHQKGKKAMNVTFDDSSSESESSQESEGEVKQNFVAFTASLLSPQEQGEDEEDISNHSSSGDDMSEEDFQEELLFSRILENSKSLTKKNKELLMKVTSLEVEKKDLILQMNEYPKKAIEDSEILKGKEKEIKILKNDLGMAHERITSLLNEMKMVKEELCKSEEMLMKFNHGSNNLMSMMSGAKYSGDRKGLGFDNCKGASTSTSTTFVKAKVFPSSQTGSGILAKEQVSMPVDQQQSSKHFTKSQAETRNTRRSSQTIHTCSYCGYRGHLQNTCKFYLDDLHHTHRERKRLKMFKQLQQKARALTGEIGRLTNPSFRKNIYSGKIYVEKESQQRYTSKPTDTTPKKKEKWFSAVRSPPRHNKTYEGDTSN